MAITDFSKQYHEKMFPGYTSKFLETDPEFIERFDNFAFDEVINMPDIGGKEVNGRIRHIALLATLLGCQRLLDLGFHQAVKKGLDICAVIYYNLNIN